MTLSADVLDRISLFAVVTDAAGVIQYVNAAGREASALASGQTFTPGHLPPAVRLVRSPAPGSDRFTTALDVGEEPRLVEWSPSSISDTEWLYLGKDVTRDRRSYALVKELARNAADAGQAKMRFLATMSHEMRTPLNGILGMNGLLLDTDLDANQRTYAEAVRQSGTALLALINDILDYSKIEAGHVDLEEQWFDPVALVQGVTELLSPRAADRGLEIAAYVDPALPPRLFGDEGRLRQVLLNLAGNGMKFTDTGGVGLEIRRRDWDKPGEVMVEMTVRDTGIGIPDESLPYIFEEFTQADDSRARRHEGTGLGLTIAQQIVNAMGGKISVDSRVGVGSTFRFAVAMKARGVPAPIVPPTQGPVVVATTHGFLRQMLALQLEALDVPKVIFAATGAEALGQLARHPGATLLCDLPLAALDGPRLAEAASQSLVLLSPLARGRLESFRKAGFSGYLIKPIRQASLSEQLAGRRDEEDRRGAPPTPAPVRTAARAMRVLLAEDNQINSILAQTILRRAGHHVDVAATGQEVIDAFGLAHYDVVLMDMRMPVIDGLEATRRLRDGEGADVPIIALTANASSEDREACLEAGMNDFIAKPFDAADLVAMVSQWGEDPEADAPVKARR